MLIPKDAPGWHTVEFVQALPDGRRSGTQRIPLSLPDNGLRPGEDAAACFERLLNAKFKSRFTVLSTQPGYPENY